MSKFTLPVDYDKLWSYQKKAVREQYIKEQNGLCMFCNGDLKKGPPRRITDLEIKWSMFPPGFLQAPVHLQHNHNTGLTEGAVHAYCNAVLWQYHGR